MTCVSGAFSRASAESPLGANSVSHRADDVKFGAIGSDENSLNSLMSMKTMIGDLV